MTNKPTPKEIDDLVYELRQAGKDDTYSLASAVLAKWGTPAGAEEPYGCVTTHSVTGQQFFYRHPESPYLDNASECVTVYAKEKHPRQSDQDHAQMAGYDASGIGPAGGLGANQHHEHRIGEPDPQREESERDSGRTGVHGPCDVSKEIATLERLLAVARNWGEVEPYLCRSGSGEQRYRIVFGVHERAANFAKELVATTQPTQPQAGAVPLTSDQVKAILVESGYYNADAQHKSHFMNGIRHGEAAHGIKHGANHDR